MTKILVLTNNNLLSLGVTSCLQNRFANITCQRENTWKGAQNALAHTHFDLLIVDSCIFVSNDVRTFSEIRGKYPSLKTILLINEELKAVALTYLNNAVEGLCMTSICRQEFLHACGMIMNGKKYIDQRITDYFLSKLTDSKNVPGLSPRESHIANLIFRGMQTIEIANKLDLALSTVNTIKFTIYRKIKAQNIADLLSRLGQVSDRIQPS
jgi:two-component system invasion response regulator UvrY